MTSDALTARRTQSVAITHYALCCALGDHRDQVARALRAGHSPLRAYTEDARPQTYVGAVDAALDPLPHAHATYDNRLTRLMRHVLRPLQTAIDAAITRWGASRVAIVIGGSTGGLALTEQAYRASMHTGTFPAAIALGDNHDLHAVVRWSQEVTGARGPAHVISTACSSSGKALASAQRLIAADMADVVITGGVDSLCQTTLRGFDSLGILSKGPCQPFGAQRSGINIGEGAAVFLVAREGEARARLLGVGESSDAHHMTAPHPEGLGAITAMQQALQRAGLAASDVDLVNAHGTGTKQNDAAESAAIAAVLGRDVPTVSTKGYTGHALGAAGAIEAALSLISIEEGFIPVSLGAEPRDSSIDIAIVQQPITRAVRHVLSNSFAFGGSNVSVLLGAP